LRSCAGGGAGVTVAAVNLFPSEDADIGAGLIYFALLLAVSATWGLWDGFHAETLPPVFVRWVVVAVVVGLVFPLRIWTEEGRDFEVLWSDLAFLTPFIAGLVLVPAGVGIAIGQALNSRRRPSQVPHHTSL
jgi:hypothetical protein